MRTFGCRTDDRPCPWESGSEELRTIVGSPPCDKCFCHFHKNPNLSEITQLLSINNGVIFSPENMLLGSLTLSLELEELQGVLTIPEMGMLLGVGGFGRFPSAGWQHRDMFRRGAEWPGKPEGEECLGIVGVQSAA